MIDNLRQRFPVLQRLADQPRSTQWLIWGLTIMVAILVWNELVLTTATRWWSQGDAKVAQIRELDAADMLPRDVQASMSTFGEVELPPSEQDGRIAMTRTVNEILKSHNVVTDEFEQIQTRPMSSSSLPGVAEAGFRIHQIFGGLSFSATPEKAIAIIAALEAAPAIKAIPNLVISTEGRGFWILDDITPLQQLTSDVLSASSHLFTPRPAYRFRTITRARFMPDDPGIGQNPDYGASINYYLGSAPQDSVTITISDHHGETIRTLNGTKETGINRIMWDLKTERSQEIRLRTSPLYAPDFRVGPEGWRAYPGSGSGRISVLVAPGTYTVTLSVDGETHTQQLAVLKDPNTAGSEADIRAKVEMLLDTTADC